MFKMFYKSDYDWSMNKHLFINLQNTEKSKTGTLVEISELSQRKKRRKNFVFI